MNIEDIEKFLIKNEKQENAYVKISFRKRNAVYGLFVKDKDYSHLKSKNFWRIVTKTHFDEFSESQDISLAKIFNGAEFSRLAHYSETVE
jgi:hypothetical protein